MNELKFDELQDINGGGKKVDTKGWKIYPLPKWAPLPFLLLPNNLDPRSQFKNQSC